MALGTLALFVVSLGYGVVVPLLPELAGGAAQTDASLVSVVYAAYAAAKIVAQVPGGVWVDHSGPERVLRVGTLLFTLSLAGFLFDGGLLYFALVRAVEGAATGIVYPAVFALALRESPERSSGKRIGLAVGLGSSGLLIGPALAGLLAPFGPRAPVAVALAGSACIALLAFAVKGGASPSAARRTVSAELALILRLAGSAAFVGLCLPIAFNKLVSSSFMGLLPLYGPASLELGTRGVTALFALTGVCFGIAQLLGGVLADRIEPRRLVLAMTPALLASLALMGVASRWQTFTLAYASYVCLSSAIFTATLKHAARAHGTDDTYGGVFGVLATLTDLMTIAGPLLFLNLYASSGGAVFYAMALVGLPFAAGFLWLGRTVTTSSPGVRLR